MMPFWNPQLSKLIPHVCLNLCTGLRVNFSAAARIFKDDFYFGCPHGSFGYGPITYIEDGSSAEVRPPPIPVGPLRARPCCPRSLRTLSAAGLATDPAPDPRSHASWLMHYAC